VRKDSRIVRFTRFRSTELPRALSVTPRRKWPSSFGMRKTTHSERRKTSFFPKNFLNSQDRSSLRSLPRDCAISLTSPRLSPRGACGLWRGDASARPGRWEISCARESHACGAAWYDSVARFFSWSSELANPTSVVKVVGACYPRQSSRYENYFFYRYLAVARALASCRPHSRADYCS
jgi:hypothetical protein